MIQNSHLLLAYQDGASLCSVLAVRPEARRALKNNIVDEANHSYSNNGLTFQKVIEKKHPLVVFNFTAS